MTMEDRIAVTLRAAGERIEVGEGGPAAVRLDPNPRRRTSRLVAFVGAFAAVILVAFGISLMRPGVPGSSDANTSDLNVSDSGALVWRNVVDLPAGISVELLAHGPAGWVALTQNNRQSNDYSSAPILGSDDGISWSELRPGGLPDVVHVQGMVGQADTYFAFGLYASANYTVTTRDRPSNFPEPSVWTSPDGVDWSVRPLPLPPAEEALSDVVSYSVIGAAAIDSGVVVVGTEFDEALPMDESGVYAIDTRVVVWTSDDLENWRLVNGTMPPAAEAVASGPGGVLAASYDVSGGATLWRTQDGISWDLVGSFASTPGGPLYVQGSDTGYVLSLGTVAMFSRDGVTWSELDGIDGLIGGGPGGFASVGSAVQWSPDGRRWRDVGPSDLLAQLEWTTTVGVDRGAVIVAGRDGSGDGKLVVGTNP
jgi:hypothetical protein